MPDNMRNLFNIGMPLIQAESDVLSRCLHSLADRIRNFSENQVDYWKRVPWLALEADGKKGEIASGTKYSLAYRHGFWAIDPHYDTNTSRYGLYVDLNSGRLVDSAEEALPYEENTATDSSILEVFAVFPHEFDSSLIVDRLTKEAQKHDFWRNKEMKKALRVNLGLTPVYERRNHLAKRATV